MKIRIDHKKRTLEGDCTILCQGKATKVDRKLSFQFLDGRIEKLLVDDEAVTNYACRPYPGLTEAQAKQYDLKELEVTVPAGIAARETFSIRVLYRDDDFYATAVNPEDGKPFSLGQIRESDAFSSHINYYPFLPHAGTNGDIFVITNLPDSVAVSSGKLVSCDPAADGFATFHYRTEHGSGLLPFPFAIGKYDAMEETACDGKTRIRICSLPGDAAFAKQKMPIVQDIFAMYVSLFGEYPFPELAIVETDPREGNIGLAAQSVIMLSRKVWFAATLDAKNTGLSNDALYVLADEINHQWNAYKVGSPNYLAEGISRYVDSLYGERLGGFATLKAHMQETAASFFHLVGKSGVEDKAICDPTVAPTLYFIKGAMALHMLRKMLGDESFKSGMRRYFTDFAGKATTLADFRSAFERSSGRRLDWFFAQWYERPGWPRLSVAWEPVSGTDRPEVGVTIVQKGPTLFRLEGFPVRLKHDRTAEDVDVTIEAVEKQTIRIGVSRQPQKLEFDPDGWFLRNLETGK
ncbi:MAG: hypothetical protein HYY17_03195 [Planctomycetes bacterium]|nr:hypothetical protein [Planctomycetota bacterium]